MKSLPEDPFCTKSKDFGKRRRVQGDESVSRSHCLDLNPDLHNSFAQQTVKDLSPFTSHYSPKNPPQPSLTKGGSKAAFTLAEVLITLGIIGVVAALTMPVLIQNHKKTEIATSMKKLYSTTSQAILMSEIDNGPSKDWVKEEMARDEEGNLDYAGQASRALTYFNSYLAKYIKYVKIDENPEEWQNDDGQANMIKVYLADGTHFYFNNGTCANFIYDANGDKKPNEYARDRFSFLLCPANQVKTFFGEGKNNFGPYCGTNLLCGTRDLAKTQCSDEPKYCGALLMYDGWEFKSDYPHKL